MADSLNLNRSNGNDLDLSDVTDAVLSACSHCGKCTTRCEVLSEPSLDIGTIQEKFDELDRLDDESRGAAIVQLLTEDYLLYNALRQCCFCGYCTAECKSGLKAPSSMRQWRKWFTDAGLIKIDDSKLVMVDNEWNIFSAYRAIYEVAYPDFITLDKAAEAGPGLADTLFFPGCSLVSYAPEVVKATGKWLDDCEIKWAMSDACCGSPLMSAGLFERAESFRNGLIEKMEQAGIKRLITVCPGCADEFREGLPNSIELVPLPELLLEESQRRIDSGMESGFNVNCPDKITFFDSCHDRDDVRNAKALRELFKRFAPESEQIEMPHSHDKTLCCGAGGAVAAYDPYITDRRVWRVIDEANATGAAELITMCPTCAYTIAQANLSGKGDAVATRHYLEMLFDIEVDWPLVFYQLTAMWNGEYADWLNATFF